MGKSLGEIFSDLHDLVQKQVDEADKKGFAGLYKAAAEKFFTQHENAGFHPVDIEYLSGYYIFGYGTNSVVHYRLKECPGWLFGFWFNEPDKEHDYVPAEWFCQFEATIDKFKPSASIITENIRFYGDPDCGAELDWRVENQLKFIRDEPYLAFCRDYHCWNYNIEYHTREEAYNEYVKWQERERAKADGEKLYVRKILEAILNNLPEGAADTMYLDDRGKYISPRYEIGYYNPDIDFEDEDNPDRTSGLYDWDDICSTLFHMSDEDIAKIQTALDDVEEWRDNYCEEHDCYFWSEVNQNCWIASSEPWPDGSPTLKQFLNAE